MKYSEKKNILLDEIIEKKRKEKVVEKKEVISK